MRAASLAVLLFAAPSWAAVVNVASTPSAFPSDYLRSVSLSLAAEPFYASHFLNSFSSQLATVASFQSPPAAAAWLIVAAGDGRMGLAGVKAMLGREALKPATASALLIANSLSRPEQFRRVMDGLEGLKPGLGKHAAAAMSGVSGTGDRRLLAALRAAGERKPQAEGLTYGADGKWTTFFDGGGLEAEDSVVAGPRDEAARARLPALTKPR